MVYIQLGQWQHQSARCLGYHSKKVLKSVVWPNEKTFTIFEKLIQDDGSIYLIHLIIWGLLLLYIYIYIHREKIYWRTRNKEEFKLTFTRSASLICKFLISYRSHSIQEFVKIESWLLLTDLFDTFTQVISSKNSIISY